eukprot:5988109-Amphidinium_carterae.1
MQHGHSEVSVHPNVFFLSVFWAQCGECCPSLLTLQLALPWHTGHSERPTIWHLHVSVLETPGSSTSALDSVNVRVACPCAISTSRRRDVGSLPRPPFASTSTMP